MNKKKSLWSELCRQLANVPLYAEETEKRSILHHPKMDFVNHQIEEAIATNPGRPIFLVGPFGAGKTTQLKYFLSKHPEYHSRSHSFNKANSLDLAFSNITKFSLRVTFFVLIGALFGGLMYLIPHLDALPVMLVAVLLASQQLSTLMYLFHEVVDTAFRRKAQVVVIEDLERSALSAADQWAFLANLWSYKRIYLVTLGYAHEKKEQVLELMEMALKLGGTFIELPVLEKATYSFIKRLDSDFPFRHREKDAVENKGWLSLFTYREMLVLREQVVLRTLPDASSKKLQYIETALELLLGKLGLAKSEITFVRSHQEIRGFSPDKYSEEQRPYLESFMESLQGLVSVAGTVSPEAYAETPAPRN